MNRELIVITCPKCGREYLPSEIFIPKSFFGDPDLIQRDTEGKIIVVSGDLMDLHESYICDCCGTAFLVNTEVSFNVEVDVKNDFSNDYVSTLKPRFKLKEF